MFWHLLTICRYVFLYFSVHYICTVWVLGGYFKHCLPCYSHIGFWKRWFAIYGTFRRWAFQAKMKIPKNAVKSASKENLWSENLSFCRVYSDVWSHSIVWGKRICLSLLADLARQIQPIAITLCHLSIWCASTLLSSWADIGVELKWSHFHVVIAL